MSLSPVAFIAPNYRDYKGWWLKFYSAGTTTPKTIILNSGGTTSSAAKLQLNKDGFITSSGGTIVVPYITGAYDAYLFPTAIEADANNTAQAVRVADGLTNELASSVVVFDNVAEMKSAVLNAGQTAMCKRYYADGDLVNGLVFTIVSGGAGVEDGGLFHNLVNGGQAQLIRTDALYAKTFGAIGDESTDNTNVIQTMIDSPSDTAFRNIWVENGCYFSLKNLTYNNDVNISYRANDELDSPSTFGQATEERVQFSNCDNNAGSVNEWQFSSPLHPGLILDVRSDVAIRGAGTNVGLGSVVVRDSNINQWQFGRNSEKGWAVSNWEYRYTLVGISTSSFSILTPVAGDILRGNTSLAEGFILSIDGSQAIVSWDKGVYQEGETVKLIRTGVGSEDSSTTISSFSASFTNRLNRIICAKNGTGQGANMPADRAIYQWSVGGVLAIEDSRGGVYGASLAGFRMYDDLQSPNIGFRVALNSGNNTIDIFNESGTLICAIEKDTGLISSRGGVEITSTLGGMTTSSFTTSQLDDITSPINSTYKKVGMMVYNLQTDRPVWASGAGAGDVWRFADGTTAHTPT